MMYEIHLKYFPLLGNSPEITESPPWHLFHKCLFLAFIKWLSWQLTASQLYCQSKQRGNKIRNESAGLFIYPSAPRCILWHVYFLFHNLEYCVMPSGVTERVPWRGRPHGDPDGWLGLHHSVRAERAISRMLAEHVQAAQLLLPHLRSHWHPGEKLPGELPFRWKKASSTHPIPHFSCLA